jgi:cytochrome oxidase Cu insertion factor (SCO1/SenC/PrrC family)
MRFKQEMGGMKNLRNLLAAGFVVVALLLVPGARAQQSAPRAKQQSEISHTFLKVGDMAPDFTLRSDQGTTVKLSDFRGKKNVIVAFYVLAFTAG